MKGWVLSQSKLANGRLKTKRSRAIQEVVALGYFDLLVTVNVLVTAVNINRCVAQIVCSIAKVVNLLATHQAVLTNTRYAEVVDIGPGRTVGIISVLLSTRMMRGLSIR